MCIHRTERRRGEEEEEEEPDDDTYEENDDPWEDPDGWWNNDYGVEDEDEPVCTCDMGLSEGNNGMIPVIKDTNGILSNLKNWVNSSLDSIKNSQASENMPQAGINRMTKDLGFLNTIFAEMEDSGRNFNFKLNAGTDPDKKEINGVTTRDSVANEYVINLYTTPGATDYEVNMLLAHELMHVHQILNGKLNTSDGVHYGLEDEVEANNLERGLKAGVPETPDYITAQDVAAMKDFEDELIYGKVPLKRGKCAVHG